MTRSAPAMPEREALSGFAIGVDVGGTKIASGLVDLATGAVSHAARIATEPTRSGAAILADVRAELERLVAVAAEHDVVPVCAGIGVPELVDGEGRIFSGYRIHWSEVDVQHELSDVIDTWVDSDVRAAALAEARYGAGRSLNHVIYVSIGTGVSAVLVQHGRPYLGSRGAALVLANGHTTFTCPSCGAHHVYVLEDFASGPALAMRYAEATGRTVSTEEVLRSAELASDASAVRIVESAAEALGNALALLAGSLDPEAIVVGGGLGSGSDFYRERIANAVRRHLWQDDARPLLILAARLGADAGLVGAAASAAIRMLRLGPTMQGLNNQERKRAASRA